jgi:hypothetical protein
MADLTGRFRSTSTSRGKRLLNPDPIWLYDSTSSPSLWIWTRKPSNLISCCQSLPAGTESARIIAVRTNFGRLTELFVRSRGRLARDIFPAKHSPDWHQNDETRHELEKLYAEWGLDIRRLRGERPHTRVIAAPSVSLRKKRRSRAKSHWMK